MENFYDNLTPSERIRLEFDSRLARCVERKRKELNLTQKELADKSGVHRGTIVHLERRNRSPSLDVIMKILTALDMSLEIHEKGDSHV